jgi:PqqD family protein of HPr-rel-A system
VLYARRSGVELELLGQVWVAYSAATGETALLNDESAAILELLDAGADTTLKISSVLAEDCGVDPGALAETIEKCWPRLLEAGLVDELSGPA